MNANALEMMPRAWARFAYLIFIFLDDYAISYLDTCIGFGEMAELVEGTPLLREQWVKPLKSSNLFLSAISLIKITS